MLLPWCPTYDLGASARCTDRTALAPSPTAAATRFIDPDLEQIKASHRADAQAVELHTGRFCEARSDRDRAKELTRIIEGAKAAHKLGLRVAAGHGLDYWNVKPVCRIEEITELNIGYSIICRAVLTGLEKAVRDMKELIE